MPFLFLNPIHGEKANIHILRLDKEKQNFPFFLRIFFNGAFLNQNTWDFNVMVLIYIKPPQMYEFYGRNLWVAWRDMPVKGSNISAKNQKFPKTIICQGGKGEIK